MSKTALIVGATGLVGSYLLDFLLASPHYHQVNVLSRRATGKEHEKLEEIILDFDKMAEHASQIKAEDVFCVLGITRKKAGSIEKARIVEYDYPLALAHTALQNGAKQFMLVSSLGADAQSKNYYLRTKGELEQALQALDFRSLKIYRPSILLGPREEIRIAEDLAKVFAIALSVFIPMKYRGINAKTVAKFAELTAKKAEKGLKIYESDKIRRIEKRSFDIENFQEKTTYRGED